MDRGQGVYDWWAGHQRLFRLLASVGFAGREAELRSRSVGASDDGGSSEARPLAQKVG